MHAVGKSAGVDNEPPGMRLPCFDTVPEADLGRVQIQPVRHQVQLAFHRETSLRNSVPSHSPSNGLVRIHMVALVEQIGHVVWNHEEKAR